jgi:hypothetical protein
MGPTLATSLGGRATRNLYPSAHCRRLREVTVISPLTFVTHLQRRRLDALTERRGRDDVDVGAHPRWRSVRQCPIEQRDRLNRHTLTP